MRRGDAALRALARRHGVQLTFRDVRGRVQRAPRESVIAVLRALGADVETVEREDSPVSRDADQSPAMPDVTVAWDGRLGSVQERVDVAEWVVQLEDGSERRWPGHVSDVADADPLPLGYHQLVGRARTGPVRTDVVSAPRRLPIPATREWAAFLPLHALWSGRSMGVGDLTDLEALLRWTGKLGGAAVGTLPLFAAFLEEPFDPSPYSPVSRLFYNELYADPERTHEFDACRAARDLVSSGAFQAQIDALRREELVDYRTVFSLKRQVLEALAVRFFDAPGDRLADFERHEPLAWDYARFRARKEGPHGLQAAERYHVYAQLVMHEQLAAVAGCDATAGLHLDMPLGAHGDGFDVAHFSEAFASDMSVGAPPDDFFEGGQNWGFPPLHPTRGLTYFRAVAAKAMRTARVMRIDHVMGLHRQFWIPHGASPDGGLYVRYPADVLYATLVLEAHRSGTTLVGEDLGTVPRQVRSTMRRRGVLSTYVLQFETQDDASVAIGYPSPTAMACTNTHDMAPFAAFWERLSPKRRRAIAAFLKEHVDLKDGTDTADVLRAAAAFLARSDAPVVLLNLEDLWGERRPQNEPGTTLDDRPNWQRKAQYALESFTSDRRVLDTLSGVTALRMESA